MCRLVPVPEAWERGVGDRNGSGEEEGEDVHLQPALTGGVGLGTCGYGRPMCSLSRPHVLSAVKLGVWVQGLCSEPGTTEGC